MMIGIGVGHLWIFCDDTLPETHNIYITGTPKWFVRFQNWVAIKIDNLTTNRPQVNQRGGAPNNI